MQPVVEGIARDLSYALRTLRRAPVFSAVAVAILALGIGATTAVFSVADAVLVRGLPYRDSSRLMAVYESDEHGHFRVPSFPTFEDWQLQSTSGTGTIEGLAFVRGNGFSLPGVDGPRTACRRVCDSRIFFGDGNPPDAWALVSSPTTRRPGALACRGALLRLLHRALRWRPRGARQDTRRRQRVGDDRRCHAARFRISEFFRTDVAPARNLVAGQRLQIATQRTARLRGLHVDSRTIVRRSHRGVDSTSGVAALRAIESRLAQLYPEQAHWTSVILQPVGNELFGNVRPGLILLSVAIVLVVLLACANVTNILLARAGARARELAVRTALGAGRWRIARQLLAEAVVLATASGAIGLALAFVLVGMVRHAAGDRLPFASQIIVNGPVALFAAVVTLGVALMVGGAAGHARERRRSGMEPACAAA